MIFAMFFACSIGGSLAWAEEIVISAGTDSEVVNEILSHAHVGDEIIFLSGEHDLGWYQHELGGVTVRGEVDADGVPTTFLTHGFIGSGVPWFSVKSMAQVTEETKTRFEDLVFSGIGLNTILSVGRYSDLVVENCTFENGNSLGDVRGGAVQILSPDGIEEATFSRCRFFGNKNSAVNITDNQDSILFVECRFEENSGTRGGGIYSSGSRVRIEDCSFTSNTGYTDGGAVAGWYWSDVTILRSVFCENIGPGCGQAVHMANGGILTASQAMFCGNGVCEQGNAEIVLADCLLMDECTDCDGDGLLDFLEILAAPHLDCDRNGRLDTCDDSGEAPDDDRVGGVGICKCNADFNNDAVIDAGDLGQLMAAWGPAASKQAAADLNGDGFIDASDLGLLVASWGPCK